MENEELECFASAFRISPYIVFEVRYNHVGDNQDADFATSAEVLNRRKSDYNQCGQCQEDVLPEGSPALAFYQKWDSKHLHSLSAEEYNEMKNDLQELQSKYPNIYKVGNSDIRFSEVVDLSKQKTMKESKLEEDSKMGEYDLRQLVIDWCDREEDIRYMDVDEVVDNYTDTLVSSEDIGKYGFDGQADYDTIRIIVQEEVESYIEEHNDIYAMAEDYDGTGATDYLDSDEWKEIFENAPETYKNALKARLDYFDGVQEMPDPVWNWLMESVDEQIGFINFSPDAVIDNVLYNGEYGEFDEYKEEDETDEEFIAREEGNCILIDAEERFIIYSL